MQFSKQYDRLLLDLAWSLWTELGCAGVKRKHQNVLVPLEELVFFTASLASIDPRLRDESLDWCSQYHHFISLHRLNTLMEDFDEKAFSQYAANLNEIARIKWKVPVSVIPQRVMLSRKSVLRPCASPALLNIRIRSIFNVGAKADLITFFLMHQEEDFSISEVADIGYSKRNMAEVLGDLTFAGILEEFTYGNQFRYRLKKHANFLYAIQSLPKYAPEWRYIFKMLLAFRQCMQKIEGMAESTQAVEINNCIESLKLTLQILRLEPPLFQNDFRKYLTAFRKWLLTIAAAFAEADFS